MNRAMVFLQSLYQNYRFSWNDGPSKFRLRLMKYLGFVLLTRSVAMGYLKMVKLKCFYPKYNLLLPLVGPKPLGNHFFRTFLVVQIESLSQKAISPRGLLSTGACRIWSTEHKYQMIFSLHVQKPYLLQNQVISMANT